VYINGLESGETPLSRKLVIGRHTISVGGVARSVVVQEGDSLTENF